MSDEEYVPLIDRVREPKSRVHENLTPIARERLLNITKSTKTSQIKTSISFLMDRIGQTPIRESTGQIEERDARKYYSKLHSKFILNGETYHVLTYLERLITEMHKSNSSSFIVDNPTDKTEREPTGFVKQKIADIENVLVTEGQLWELKPAKKGGIIRFEQIESEAMEDIDEKVQALSSSGQWSRALEAYNGAFQRYIRGDFDELIPKKLYYSIEEVLKIICVDLEDWTDDREMSHAKYLQLLKENGVYKANGITAPEMGSQLDALEKMISKVGNDRKQRHAYHDRAYCTLLIHQVGAYLYFIIGRYDDYKSMDEDLEF